MLRVQGLVNVSVRPRLAKGAPAPAGEPETQSVGAFLTPQSLLSFPVASGAVTLVWKSLGALSSPLGTANWVPLVVALLVGLIIYLISVSDDKMPKPSGGMRIVGIGIAVLNAFFLFAAAVGVATVTTAH